MKSVNLLILLFVHSVSVCQVETNSADWSAFRFRAEFIFPQGLQRQYIDDASFMEVTQDSLVADLPYIGRVFSLPYGGDAGLRFVSIQFKRSDKSGKKGRWEITLEPIQERKASRIFIEIYPDRTAMVSVSSPDRAPVSYRGRVEAAQGSVR